MLESEAEITLRIVYCGVGLSGKTSNLQYVHQRTDPSRRTAMASHASATERLLSFSLLPSTLGPLRGKAVRVALFTVPGAVFYDASRRTILKGVDGIVLVVDSQAARIEQSEESAIELEADLWAIEGRRLSEVPHVVQYNKRDLPSCAPIDVLERRVNRHRTPSVEAIATRGSGVVETLRTCVGSVLKAG